MATINLGNTTVNYSFGAIIALIVLLLSIVFMALGTAVTPFMVLAFVAALALSRLC